jgi:hypothetical protein
LSLSFDETLGDILKLQILTTGFHMKAKRRNIAILSQRMFQVYKYNVSCCTPCSQQRFYGQYSSITDALNQKVEHSTIRWEDLSFPTDWVIDTPKIPIQRAITSAQIKKLMNLQFYLFLKNNFLKVHSWPKPSRPPPPIPQYCVHTSLQSLAGQVGEVPFSVKCPDCDELVSLSTLNTSVYNSNLQFQHEHHNPRNNIPPPVSTQKKSVLILNVQTFHFLMILMSFVIFDKDSLRYRRKNESLSSQRYKKTLLHLKSKIFKISKRMQKRYCI